VIDQGSGPLDDLRLHAIPDRLLTDKFVEIPWRGLERVEAIMFAQPPPSHDLDEIAHLNHMVENDDGRTRHTASGSSQAIMHATVQQQALGPRDQVVSQIVSEPSLTTSGSGMFDRQALNAQIRLNVEMARYRVNQGWLAARWRSTKHPGVHISQRQLCTKTTRLG
jgi:hypothetical protein